jgi:hypothetical protein
MLRAVPLGTALGIPSCLVAVLPLMFEEARLAPSVAVTPTVLTEVGDGPDLFAEGALSCS